ncbi:MAG: leucine-rich repeat domain-containing protein [Candidatus Margulisbacteria bacterium]|nr:leucine-rich repeat domain-containing protein [Candidatus Margulisiibacteriota bacterium]
MKKKLRNIHATLFAIILISVTMLSGCGSSEKMIKDITDGEPDTAQTHPIGDPKYPPVRNPENILIVKPELDSFVIFEIKNQIGNIQVKWDIPESITYESIVLVRSEKEFPISVDAGVVIDIDGHMSHTDTNIDFNVPYYYTLFAKKSDGSTVELGRASTTLEDTVVEFEADIEAAVRIEIGQVDGPILSSSLKKVECLSIYYGHIESLEILQHFPNIKEIFITNTTFSNKKSLFSNSFYTVREVSLVANNLGTVSNLNAFDKLDILHLDDNNLKEFDAASIPVSIRELYLNGNELTEIKNLSRLVNLEYLHVERNNITDITPFVELYNDPNSKLINVNIFDNPADTQNLPAFFNQMVGD